ncbi:MAG: hypothetical protein WDM70_03850 [Nitrosomonadales bacterium]
MQPSGGLSGGLFAGFQGFISPESFSLTESVMILVYGRAGRHGQYWRRGTWWCFAGSIAGSVAQRRGAGAAMAVRQTLVDPESLRMLLFGLALIVVMLVRPAGTVAFDAAPPRTFRRR